MAASGEAESVETGIDQGRLRRNCLIIALQLAQDGFDLLLISHNEARLKIAAQRVETAHPATQVETIGLDVSDADAVRKALSGLKDRRWRFTVLVNAADISGGDITHDLTTEL